MSSKSVHMRSFSKISGFSFWHLFSLFYRINWDKFIYILVSIQGWIRPWPQRNRLRINLSPLINRQVLLRRQVRGSVWRNFWSSRRFRKILIFIAKLWTWTWIRTRAGHSVEEESPSLALPREGEDVCWDSAEGWVSREDSGRTGAKFSPGVWLCSFKYMPESSVVGVATGQFSPSLSKCLLPFRIFLLN